MRPPVMAIPIEKEPASPMIPIPIGMAPPPKTKAKGTVSETATFLALGGPMEERAAKPGGKKQTAMMGCRKTMLMIKEGGAAPSPGPRHDL